MNRNSFKEYVSHKTTFKNIDDLAYNKLTLIVNTIITNIFNNLQLVLKAYPAKRITKKQFAIVLNIMSRKLTCQEHKFKKVTGGTVMTGTFFNPENTAGYYENVPEPEIPINITRGELQVHNNAVEQLLDAQTGGGNDDIQLVDDKYIKEAFEKFKKENGFDATLSKEAIQLMKISIDTNLEMLFKDCGNGVTLTGKKIYNILKTKPRKFVHLSCIATY